MIEKKKYRGTRGRIEIIEDVLAVVFDIKSPESVLKIRKHLFKWLPTAQKFHWETVDRNDMHVPTKGNFKNTFKFDGEYPIDLPKEALPEVIKAIGYQQASPEKLAHLAKGRAMKHAKQAKTSIGEVK